MMKRLVEAGHRDMAIFTPVNQPARYEEATQGALNYLRSSGLENHVKVRICRHSSNQAELRLKAERLFNRKHRPTGAIFTGISSFITIYPVLRRLGIEIPSELSVIGRGSPLYTTMQNEYQWVDMVEQDLDF